MTVIGTPVYMAPEVLSKSKYSEKADIYSFGVLLCEIFTGEYPYSHEPYDTMNSAQLTYHILENGVRPDLMDIHPSLQQLIQECWSTDSSLRPSAQELVMRLKQLRRSLSQSEPA